jgi:hypothetical protein
MMRIIQGDLSDPRVGGTATKSILTSARAATAPGSASSPFVWCGPPIISIVFFSSRSPYGFGGIARGS